MSRSPDAVPVGVARWLGARVAAALTTTPALEATA